MALSWLSLAVLSVSPVVTTLLASAVTAVVTAVWLAILASVYAHLAPVDAVRPLQLASGDALEVERPR